MSYPIQPPPAAPAEPHPSGPPSAVTVASTLLWVMAVAGLLYAAVTIAVMPGVVHRFRAGATGDDVDAYVSVIWLGAAVALAMAVILFALYVVLGVGLRRGSNGARIATLIVSILGLLGGAVAAITVGIERSGDNPAGSVGAQLTDAYPSGWIGTNAGLALAQIVAYAVVLTLVLRAPRAFFSAPRAFFSGSPSQPAGHGMPPAYGGSFPPGYPSGYPTPGHPASGYPAHGQPGYAPPGYPSLGQPGYVPSGYPASPGYPAPTQPGYPAVGYPSPDDPREAGPSSGYPAGGHAGHGAGYPVYGAPGYPVSDQSGYAPAGYPQGQPGYAAPAPAPGSQPSDPAASPQPSVSEKVFDEQPAQTAVPGEGAVPGDDMDPHPSVSSSASAVSTQQAVSAGGARESDSDGWNSGADKAGTGNAGPAEVAGEANSASYPDGPAGVGGPGTHHRPVPGAAPSEGPEGAGKLAASEDEYWKRPSD